MVGRASSLRDHCAAGRPGSIFGAPKQIARVRRRESRMASSGSFLSELKRRRVLRVAGVYAVAAWAVLQVATTVAPLLSLPAWTPRLVLLLLALGFPVALVLAWAFELTPDGLRREAPAGEHARAEIPGSSTAPRPAGPRAARSPAAYLGLGILVALVGFAAYARFRPVALAPAATGASGTAGDRSDGAADGAQPESARSIAVLPFVNMSGQKENEYFSDGITEEIQDALAKVPGLAVAARTSAFAFKGKSEDVAAIGRALRVRHLLEGSVQRAGGRVRITAQLIDAENGYQLWSEKYDRDARDVFAVEDDISRAIAEQLRATLGTPRALGAAQALGAAPTRSIGAHDLYLLGLDRWTHRNRESLHRAVDYFQRAVAADSSYAQAWAGLALADAVLPVYDPGLPAAGTWAEGREAAHRALALDPRSAEAHAALGNIAQYYDQLPTAERELREALRLNPNYATGDQWLAEALLLQGRLPDALASIDRALALDPLAPVMLDVRLLIRQDLGDVDGALSDFQRAIALDPHFPFAADDIALLALATGRFGLARRTWDAHPGLARDSAEADLIVDGVADPARRPKLVRLLGQPAFRERAAANAVALYDLAGERDSALAVASRLAADPVQGHDLSFRAFLLSPAAKELRDDPRLPAFLRTTTTTRP